LTIVRTLIKLNWKRGESKCRKLAVICNFFCEQIRLKALSTGAVIFGSRETGDK